MRGVHHETKKPKSQMGMPKPENPVPGPHIKVPKMGSIQIKAPLHGPKDGKV